MFSLEVSWPSGVVGGEWPGNECIDWVIFKSWLSATGKNSLIESKSNDIESRKFLSINELYQNALLNFNLKLILILLNLYWCQNQRFPFLESTTGSRNSLAIHEMQRNALVRTHSSWRGKRESCVTKSIAWLQTWILAQLGKRLCQYSIELASCLSQSDHLSCNNVYEWWYLPPS